MKTGYSNNPIDRARIPQKPYMKKPIALRTMAAQEIKTLWSLYREVSREKTRSGVRQWLYDNYYTLQAEGRSVVRSLRHENPLPCMESSSVPVVYHLVSSVFVAKRTELTGESLEQFLCEIQRDTPLAVAELCFVPTALRCAYISVCRKACEQDATDKDTEDLFAYGICSLRAIGDLCFEDIFNNCSAVERVLQQDPSGDYPNMDEESKNLYRFKISRIAVANDISELQAAKNMLAYVQNGQTPRERHIGHPIFLVDDLHQKAQAKGRCALMLTAVIPLILSVTIGLFLQSIWPALLLYLPLWEIVRPLIEQFAMRGVPATVIPRIALERDLPSGADTLVTVSTLMPRPEDAPALEKHLENLFITNGGEGVGFMVLADFKEDKEATNPKDMAMLTAAQGVVTRLNARFGDCFYLLVRKRSYNKSSKRFGGWERKRGAITQLVRFIRGQSIPVKLFCGNMDALRRTRYILALDADTGLLLGSVAQLVGAAIHPLNRAEVSRETGVVTRGYGIFLPRISVSLASAYKTGFSKVMAGCGGITAYGAVCPNLYQDLFGSAVFSGKGLIDVRAFFEVMDQRFDEGVILSHDILEGEYLRTAYVSDVELTESFPQNAASFFSRQHRWIRGDVQNAPFVFRSVARGGVKERNVLSGVSRYKLFDNIRRALTPVAAYLCIAVAFFADKPLSYSLALGGFFTMTAPQLLSAVAAIFSSRGFALSREYYSKVLPAALESVSQAFFSFVFLPKHAFMAADAVIRSLYRMTVSHEKLLEWTTAADAERGGKRFFSQLQGLLPGVVSGIVLLLSSVSILRLFGILFLISPLVAFFSSKETRSQGRAIDAQTQDLLTAYAAMMWRYYEKTCTARENYLPPDNVQEAPTYVVAHRTSPTNIGLMLLCTLAARDFHFITTEEMTLRIQRSLTTILRMERYRGNLYNWYDTRTLALLQPAFVSSVDSANFLCCLVALREGIKEYITDQAKLAKITQQISTLINEADLTMFYNKRKKLFSVGYDCEKQSLVHSHYDLLMSEARLASYFAIATGQVPKKHWGALARTLARQGTFAGPISWGGSVFEYFMPHLLLPVYEGSLLYEALRFCSYCQKMRARSLSLPWGVSESGFYAFDNQLNYRYKAHGVQKLGLMRGLNNEYVVSPYSTFLTMGHDPYAALKNLAELEKTGMVGKWGFYEACDYTHRRTGAYKRGIVRSYMAHHVGMSLLSVNNAVHDNCMQRRFMSDRAMKAAQELLEEKIAAGSLIFEDVSDRAEAPRHGRETPTEEVYTEVSPQNTHVQILSNGELTAVLSDVGTQHISFGSIDITRRTTDPLRAPCGVYFVAQMQNQTVCATTAPFYDAKAKHVAKLFGSGVEYYGIKEQVEAGLQVCVHSDLPVCQYIGVVKNNSPKKEKAQVLVYFEPALAPFRDVEAHPAFTRLFLQAVYDRASSSLIFSRRTRPGESDVSVAIGFLDETPFEYETVKHNLLSLPYGIASLGDAFERPFLGGEGVPDAVCAIRAHTDIAPGAQKEFAFVIAADDTPEGAVSRVVAARRRGAIGSARAARSPVATTKLEDCIGQSVLPQLFYPRRETQESIAAALKNELGVHGLWGLSISGDFPIVLIEVHDPDDVVRCEGYIKLLQKLRVCNVFFDLVVLYSNAQQEGDTIRQTLADLAHECMAEDLLGARVGIHAVNLAVCDSKVRTQLYAAASHVVEQSLVRHPQPARAYQPLVVTPAEKERLTIVGEDRIIGGAFTRERFYVTGTPRAPWCHVLSNPAFGTLLSDKALGFSWAVNARENKLTPWFNDLALDNVGEMLVLDTGGMRFDLVNGALASFSPRDAMYEGRVAFGKIHSTVSVTISPHGCAKYLDVTLQNTTKEVIDIELCYYTEPVLGVNRSTARHLIPSMHGGMLTLSNPFNTAVGGCMAVGSDKKDVFYHCERAAFLCGKATPELSYPNDDPCAAVIHPFKFPPSGRYSVRFILSYGKDKDACVKQARGSTQRRERENNIWIDTPDRLLNHLVNTWLPHQTEHARIMGRTGYYQCGGAWGFRDQLQDVCASLLLDPKPARRHIIRAARAQFKEGDVLHWWHSLPQRGGGMRGVRTRYSDDLLWLPYTVCEYLEKTNDTSLLDVRIPYLGGAALSSGEHERYFGPSVSDETGDIYDHCCRAIDHAMRLGEHGLPLMGSGDWNDGYNLVGADGRGESVWLALFLSVVLDRFAPVCDQRGDAVRAQRLKDNAALLRGAVDEHCFDGGWYLRAFYDDGTKMGSAQNDECRIDSLPQSFAVFAGMPDKERVNTALENACTHLVDAEKGIVRLFTPSFNKGMQNPGYVKAYPPGIRENGGQYTHAAIWLAQALLKAGMTEKGYELLGLINPANKYKEQRTAEMYQLEPYYLAADVYTNPCAYGRGGWSIYTGAAGWYYRTVVEDLLGIRLRGKTLELAPRIPGAWDGFAMRLTFFGTTVRARVSSDHADAPSAISIPLDGGVHDVKLRR